MFGVKVDEKEANRASCQVRIAAVQGSPSKGQTRLPGLDLDNLDYSEAYHQMRSYFAGEVYPRSVQSQPVRTVT
jgi:hypothetical protein